MNAKSISQIKSDVTENLAAIGVKCDPEITPLAGDASNRSYYRVTFRVGLVASKMILMVLADPDPHKGAEEIEKGEVKIDELPFLNVAKLLSELGLQVPTIYHYDRPRGYILLEDFGDDLLEGVVAAGDRERTAGYYRRAVMDLAQLNYDGLRVCDETFVPYYRRFDADLLKWEFEHFVEYGIEAKGTKISDDDRNELDSIFGQLSARIAEMPKVLVHRDYHSRNLIALEGDRLGIIDFQDALLGPAPYDLASLLKDSYICLDDDLIDELIDLYLEEAAARGAELDAAGFRLDFDLQSVQRNLKAAGRFDYINLVKGSPKFLVHIPHTLQNVRKNIDRHEILAPLGKILGRYVDELKL